MIRKLMASSIAMLGDREFEARISAPGADGMDDIVNQDGADLSLFHNNPIMLFSHDPLHPVGTWSEVTYDPTGIRAKGTFAPEGMSAKADECCALLKANILKGVSIGFEPLESEPINPAQPRGPQRYKKWRLLEVSVVAIPAHPNAMVTGKNLETTVTKTRSGLKFKGLYDIGCLAQLMCELGWIHEMSVWEKACEGDDSEVPAKLLSILNEVGQTLIAMTQEEVAECLAGRDDSNDDTVEVIEMNQPVAVRKFRAGALTMKAGRAVSKATANKIQDAADSHDALAASLKLHAKCMKSFLEVQGSSGNTEGTSTKALGAATPGVMPGVADPQIKDMADSHTAVQANAVIHAKCMKEMMSLMPEEDAAEGAEDSDTKLDKNHDGLETTEQRLRKVRALELRLRKF